MLRLPSRREAAQGLAALTRMQGRISCAGRPRTIPDGLEIGNVMSGPDLHSSRRTPLLRRRCASLLTSVPMVAVLIAPDGGMTGCDEDPAQPATVVYVAPDGS